MRWPTQRGPFCRDCGLTVFREATSDTLLHGWWSLVSFVLAPLTIALNLRARAKVLALAAPRPHPQHAAPDRRPLDPVKPVFARPKPWFGLSMLAALITMAAVYLPGSSFGDGSQDGYDRVGGCVELSASRFRDGVEFVDCSQPHHARIIAVESDWSSCPEETWRFVEVGYRYYCLDPS